MCKQKKKWLKRNLHVSHPKETYIWVKKHSIEYSPSPKEYIIMSEI